MLKILPTLRDSARIDCMELVGIQYSFTNNFDSAIYYYQRIDAESRNINYKHGIALSFYIRASVAYRRDNNLPEAQAFAKESLNWFALSENKKRIEFPYLKIGITLFLEGHTEEAYPYLELSCKWSEQNKNREMLDYSIGFIYEHYRDIGDYVKAFDAFQKVLQISLSFDGKIDTTAQYYMLGELHRRIENYPVALNYYRQCIRRLDLNNSDIWFRTGYPELFALNEKFDSALYYYKQIDTAKLSTIDISFYQVSIGEFFLLKREYRQALGYLLRGLKYTRDEGNKQIDQRRRVLIDIAKSYAGLKEYSNALAYSREGLNMSLQANAKQYIRDAYQILYTIYQDQNEPDSAFIYFKKYIAQKEIVANDVLKGKFAAYNYDQKIDQLNKEKQLQQHQIKQNARQRQFLVAGIIILFVLSVAVFRNILLKRKNEAGLRKIAENELQLQKLESAKSRAELQQQATELEMQALRAQMNPHFIFNCLSSINRFILKNESD
ncbi:MAG: tetratricopeptide repeat protein, partial [Bacteroidota bacterium]